MILRPRGLLILLGACLVLGGVMGALALSRFSEDPVNLVFENRERVAIPLPNSAGRLVLERRGLSVLGLSLARQRHLLLEHAGQPVLETRLFRALRPRDPIHVFWIEPSLTVNRPFVRLREPAGEVLVDPIQPAVVRVVQTAIGPVLTSPAGDARVGVVIDADGTPRLIEGLSGDRVPSEDGRPLGVVQAGQDGRRAFVPAADATDAAAASRGFD